MVVLAALIMLSSGQSILPRVKCSVCGYSYQRGSRRISRSEFWRIMAHLTSRGYRLPIEDKRALLKIADGESDMDPLCRNHHSTAKGMYQLLDGTFKDIKSSYRRCPSCQTIQALRYIAKRYHTPRKALKFRSSRGYY